jgi:hypothetical protein
MIAHEFEHILEQIDGVPVVAKRARRTAPVRRRSDDFVE